MLTQIEQQRLKNGSLSTLIIQDQIPEQHLCHCSDNDPPDLEPTECSSAVATPIILHLELSMLLCGNMQQ